MLFECIPYLQRRFNSTLYIFAYFFALCNFHVIQDIKVPYFRWAISSPGQILFKLIKYTFENSKQHSLKMVIVKAYLRNFSC